MVNVKEKFKINIESLRAMQINVLKAIKKSGEAHLKYYYGTMSAFKNPEKRMKCHDTMYFEEVLPIVDGILKEYQNKKG